MATLLRSSSVPPSATQGVRAMIATLFLFLLCESSGKSFISPEAFSSESGFRIRGRDTVCRELLHCRQGVLADFLLLDSNRLCAGERAERSDSSLRSSRYTSACFCHDGVCANISAQVCKFYWPFASIILAKPPEDFPCWVWTMSRPSSSARRVEKFVISAFFCSSDEIFHQLRRISRSDVLSLRKKSSTSRLSMSGMLSLGGNHWPPEDSGPLSEQHEHPKSRERYRSCVLER